MNELNFTPKIAWSTSLASAGKAIDAKGFNKNSSQEKICQAAKSFESALLAKVLEGMKNTIPQSGLLETPMSRQVQDLFWFYLTQDIAGKGGLGLWKQIAGQLEQASVMPERSRELEQLL